MTEETKDIKTEVLPDFNDKFAVEFPAAGPLAVINFTVEDLETLEIKYGKDYRDKLFNGLRLSSIKMIKDLLKCGVKHGDGSNVINQISLIDLGEIIAEAIMLRLGIKPEPETETETEESD